MEGRSADQPRTGQRLHLVDGARRGASDGHSRGGSNPVERTAAPYELTLRREAWRIAQRALAARQGRRLFGG